MTDFTGNSAAHAPGLPVVAVIGDGQLARMMQTAAVELGQSIRLLAGAPDASAAQVAADVIVGDYRDLADLRRAAAGASAITFDHEHVPNEHLEALLAEGYTVEPRPAALIHAQDKLVQREKLAELGAPVPIYGRIDAVEDALALWERLDGQLCLKARRGGYDGHGVWFPGSREELADLVRDELAKGTPLMGEQLVDLKRELSAMVARTRSGEIMTWPVVESVQRDGICAEVTAPAPGLSDALQHATRDLATRVAEALDVTGVMALELFESAAGDILINELAMRPHNTGHWTQDGCVTSQFEQHLRAVLDMPLGDTQLRGACTVMVNVLGAEEETSASVDERMREVWRRYPQAKIHWYGKAWRPGRKLGHVNVVGEDTAEVRAAARAAARYLREGRW